MSFIQFLAETTSSSSTNSSFWSEYGALAAWASVLIAIFGGLLALRRDRAKEARSRAKDMEKERQDQREREKAEEERVENTLEAVVLAVLGRPASADGTFPHIPGIVDQVNELVNQFAAHSSDVREYQERTDRSITALREVLETVAAEYKTNGGSTVKDDLINIVARLKKLEKGQAEIKVGQVAAADVATEREDLHVSQG